MADDQPNTNAYCVKCREKRDMVDGEEVEMKRKGGNTGRALKGKCPTCGTTMFKILPSKPKAE